MYKRNYFSLSLPKGENQTNIPDLLEHLAKTLKEMKITDVSDITFNEDEDEDGNPFYFFNVYYEK